MNLNISEINVNVPRLYLHPKENKKNSVLKVTDFLSNSKENKYFTEEYVKDLMIASNLFSKSLIVNKAQSNGEPDIIDKNSDKTYEVKTIWGQEGCELLSLQYKSQNKMLEQALMNLRLYKNLDQHFNSALNLIDLPKEVSNLIKKMNKKQTCNYILFYPFTFSIDNDKMILASDIDAILWKNILIQNNFNFTIYMIKPTYWGEFKIVEINKTHTSLGKYFKFNNFFENYVSIIS